jgi:ABC-type uncharacterized transport system permease subunit
LIQILRGRSCKAHLAIWLLLHSTRCGINVRCIGTDGFYIAMLARTANR